MGRGLREILGSSRPTPLATMHACCCISLSFISVSMGFGKEVVRLLELKSIYKNQQREPKVQGWLHLPGPALGPHRNMATTCASISGCGW